MSHGVGGGLRGVSEVFQVVSKIFRRITEISLRRRCCSIFGGFGGDTGGAPRFQGVLEVGFALKHS